jgi:DNA polymerase
MEMHVVRDFDQWRAVTRHLLGRDVHPACVDLTDAWQQQRQLDLGAWDATEVIGPRSRVSAASPFRVPKKFLHVARGVACHRAPARWNALYRVLWRLTHGAPHLLEVVTDDDIHCLRQWHQQVRRDAHRTKAFARFRHVSAADGEWFVAWHRPDYRVAGLVAPFFLDRFAAMRWSLLMPDETLVWDQHVLRCGPGTGPSAAPREDDVEPLWVRYYAAMFNPDRANPRGMRAQMPVRYWGTLPETREITSLLRRHAADRLPPDAAGDG